MEVGLPVVADNTLSLAQALYNKCIDANTVVQEARRTIAFAEKYSPPHCLAVNDIVYYHEEPHPHWVMRVGFADYLQEIRIRRFDEPNAYSAGRWAHHEFCHLLEAGDMLMCTKEVTDATDSFLKIPKGVKCQFMGIDPDGDVSVKFSSPICGCSRTVLFIEDLMNLSLL